MNEEGITTAGGSWGQLVLTMREPAAANGDATESGSAALRSARRRFNEVNNGQTD